eukprot:2645692-Rhodomonas_salina.3
MPWAGHKKTVVDCLLAGAERRCWPQPDWDMFQSQHEAAALHASARAVGGCAVYVSDNPGQHNFDLL